MNPWEQCYRGRRVLVTGHTGFKGGWLATWLSRLGAHVTGLALPPHTTPSFFAATHLPSDINHLIGDVRLPADVARAWDQAQPEIVFHLAAQAIVRESYRSPLETVATNVLGTTHVLEQARTSKRPVALVLITSDKCYENHEWERGYTEDDELGGRDVYSGSKAAAEILISSYRRSFFLSSLDVPVASARAGNVIGGGDWSADRIVPDAVRALAAGQAVDVRNPGAVRPWQHVLEPVSGYLQLGAALLRRDDAHACRSWNFGPEIRNTRTVKELVSSVVARWGSGTWRDASDPRAPHEATLLRLDITRAQRELGWSPRWDFDTAVASTVDWYRAYYAGADVRAVCHEQIEAYEAAPQPYLEHVGNARVR